MNSLISDSVRKEFYQNGVVFLERALDTEGIRMAQTAFDWSLEHPSPGAARFPSKDDAAAIFYQDLANPKAVAAYRNMLERSLAADIAAAIWGTDDVWFMYEQVFLKEGGKSRRTPWHQDSSYLPVDGEQLAVMWIPFEPLAKENSLELVRGSHRGPLYNGSRFDVADDTAPIYPEQVLPRLPNIEADRAQWDIVSWAMVPGDVLVFHPGDAAWRSANRFESTPQIFVATFLRHGRGLCSAGRRRINPSGVTAWRCGRQLGAGLPETSSQSRSWRSLQTSGLSEGSTHP